MAKIDDKTQATDVSVDDFIAAIDHPARRAALMRWHSTIFSSASLAGSRACGGALSDAGSIISPTIVAARGTFWRPNSARARVTSASTSCPDTPVSLTNWHGLANTNWRIFDIY